jgi:acetyltransferase-like isoleucine patch superfamily enzyme
MNGLLLRWHKFDWPNQIWIALDLALSFCATLFWTFFTQINLRLHGVHQIGRGLKVTGRLHLFTRRTNSIQLGHSISITSRFRTNPVGLTTSASVFDTIMGGQIIIGDGCGMSAVVLSSRSSIHIGAYTKLGGNVRIFDHDYHSLTSSHRRNLVVDRHHVATKPVIIEEDVFIGTNAIILKGTLLGARSIVGAGAVVAGLSVPPDSVVYGNPARFRPQSSPAKRSTSP